MAVLRFTTTKLSGLRAAGRLQELQHATVALFLERELGPEYGRLFADFEAESSDIRAWYTEAAVLPRPIASLTAAEAETTTQRVAEMIERISEFAGRIGVESTQKANLARILVAATTFPVEDIWVDGAQPIIVNWGFHRQDVEAGVPRPIRDRMRRTSAARPAATVTDAATAAQARTDVPILPKKPRRRWFVLPTIFWLVCAFFVAASYGLLLPACGIVGPSGIGDVDACPMHAKAADAFLEGAELQAMIEDAELEQARQRMLCTAPRHAGLLRPGDSVAVAYGH